MNHVVEWFYNPLKGQPRYADINQIRKLANRENVQTRIYGIIDAVMSKPWQVTGKQAKEFFNSFDFTKELCSFLRDLLILDAGVFVKDFAGKKLTGLVARDGASFLKDVDVNGIVYRYWQYSYLHPQVAPIEFSPKEIVYCMLHPRSYSAYGWSPLQSERKGILNRIFRKNHLYELTPETIKAIRKTVEKTMNSNVMPELGKNAKFIWTD